MARINNLTNFLTDVATAIKTKTGDSTAIPASQFDTKIANISTGHLDNTEYQEANDDLDDILEGSTPMTIYPPDWSELGYEDTPESVIEGFNYAKDIYDNWDSSVTSMGNMYNSNTELKYFPLVDTSNVTNMYQCFLSSELTYIPAIDTSNVSSFMSAFRSCKNLISADLFDTSNASIVQQMFDSSTNLKTVPVFDISKVTDPDRMFNNCPNLSNESLNNILEMCINSNVTNTSYKKLSRVGLSSAQATICQGLSNWNDFVSAGWTTGY